jgi:hypothetical protein
MKTIAFFKKDTFTRLLKSTLNNIVDPERTRVHRLARGSVAPHRKKASKESEHSPVNKKDTNNKQT